MVSELKTLGITFDKTLTMKATVEEKYKSGIKKIWVFKRLKEFGLSVKELTELYGSICRSSIEFCLYPILPLLTKTQINKLETIQRKITKTILKDYESTYEERLKKCGLIRLEERWKTGMITFANELVKKLKVPRCFLSQG